jgi:hypothetical protein
MAEETKSVVTERVGMVTEHQMNRVIVVLMTPIKIVVVRAFRVYLQTRVGLLTALGSGVAATVGVTLTAGDFWHLLAACSSISIAPAIISAITNTVELLAKWDASHPELRA